MQVTTIEVYAASYYAFNSRMLIFVHHIPYHYFTRVYFQASHNHRSTCSVILRF